MEGDASAVSRARDTSAVSPARDTSTVAPASQIVKRKVIPGHNGSIRCSNCRLLFPVEKAFRSIVPRDIVERSASKDFQEARPARMALLGARVYNLRSGTKRFAKKMYCVECALSGKVKIGHPSELDEGPSGAPMVGQPGGGPSGAPKGGQYGPSCVGEA